MDFKKPPFNQTMAIYVGAGRARGGAKRRSTSKDHEYMIEEFKNQKILRRDLVEEMEDSYLSYAMSVIISRALPDVRDGLKPVHRRVLFGAAGIGAQWNRKHKKSARIVGEVMGKYHPHGDQSIYDSLVRMAQPWSLRYPLMDGQGNKARRPAWTR